MQSQKEELWTRLTRFFNNAESKITTDRYFEICEQLGETPDPAKIPVSWEDLPVIAQYAINIFNSLGDRLVADIGYLGKDYTALPTYIEAYEIEDVELLLELLVWMDSRAIKQSAEHMKREREKLKRKS